MVDGRNVHLDAGRAGQTYPLSNPLIRGPPPPLLVQATPLAHERQSISWGELGGVLCALLARAAGERLLVVLASEYVFNGITKWSTKWRWHGWHMSEEVGHRDLWEQILWLRESAGEMVQTAVGAIASQSARG